MSDSDMLGAGPYLPPFSDWPPEQAAALAALHETLEGFRDAFATVIRCGIKPADALAACGYEVPLFARALVNSLLAA